VERVESFNFLGVQITKELSWSTHTNTVVKKAQKHLFPLRRLKRFGMGTQILKKIYRCTIGSNSILGWCSFCLLFLRIELAVVCPPLFSNVSVQSLDFHGGVDIYLRRQLPTQIVQDGETQVKRV
jgi:hypothetical protein